MVIKINVIAGIGSSLFMAEVIGEASRCGVLKIVGG